MFTQGTEDSREKIVEFGENYDKKGKVSYEGKRKERKVNI